MDKVLENARKEWTKLHPEHINAVASIGWIDPDKSYYYWSGGCHAAMASPKYYVGNKVKTENLISVFSGIQKNETTLDKEHDDMERTFLEWLLFHSPFKGGLLPDTAEGAREHRVLMGDVDKPANLMGAALMSTRIFNEHPASLTMWWTFVKNGLHPSIAFAFSHRLYIDTSKKIGQHIPSHTGCFNGNLGVSYYDSATRGAAAEDYLLNFLQGKIINPAQTYRESASEATRSFKLWAGPNKDAKGVPKIAEVDVLLKKAALGTSAVSKNPFAKAMAKEASPMPKVDDALEVLIPYLSKYKEFF